VEHREPEWVRLRGGPVSLAAVVPAALLPMPSAHNVDLRISPKVDCTLTGAPLGLPIGGPVQLFPAFCLVCILLGTFMSYACYAAVLKLTLIIAVPAAGFLARQHNCGHGASVGERRAWARHRCG